MNPNRSVSVLALFHLLSLSDFGRSGHIRAPKSKLVLHGAQVVILPPSTSAMRLIGTAAVVAAGSGGLKPQKNMKVAAKATTYGKYEKHGACMLMMLMLSKGARVVSYCKRTL